MTPSRRNNGWMPEVFNDFADNEYQRRNVSTAPAINVKESDEDYVVELAAPGMKKDDFHVHVDEEGNLRVKFEKNSDNTQQEQKKNVRYLRREFSYSKFEQTLILPDDVDREKISARVENGVLTVVLPKLRPVQSKVARQITIG